MVCLSLVAVQNMVLLLCVYSKKPQEMNGLSFIRMLLLLLP